MYSYLRLQNFRSYTDYPIELSPKVNIIVGPNASGKTNILEAMYVLSTGKSFRAKDERNLIKFQKSWGRIDGLYKNTERTLLIKENIKGLTKTLHIDNVEQKARLKNKGFIPTTLFEPQNMKLFSDSPEARRLFLDELIEQINPQYAQIRKRYKRALQQRNRLLKSSHKPSGDELFPWDLQLSNQGALISKARNLLTHDINAKAPSVYKSISKKKNTLVFEYTQKLKADDYSSQMLLKLQQRYDLDRERGFTTIGPHRDDLHAYLDGKDAAVSASRGEIRTILLALKLVELLLLEKKTGIKPLLLLDDVFSELDGARRQALTRYLKKYQTVITTTDADAIIEHFMEDYKIIPL